MKSQRQWIMTILTLALLASGTVVSAQDKAPRPGPPPRIMMGEGGHTAFIGGDSGFMMAEMAGGKVVKGAPYSAQAVTESTQVLADGNRIVRKTTASIYRDSEGRTRHEQTLGGVGSYQTQSKQMIAINDPVGGAHYMLDPESKTAHKMSPPPGAFMRTRGGEATSVHVQSSSATTSSDQAAQPQMRHEGGHFNVQIAKSSDDDSSRKVESLGTQTIEGVQVEGTRVTHTIAIGEVGNEQPINIVMERWYSPELQVVVMMKHSDPRNGENTYKLVNINRSEPADSLFKVPSDYSVKEGGGKPGMRMEMRKKPANEQ
jgi:hypothetical protein